MKKERITLTLDKELLDWIDKNIGMKIFASRSHAVEFLIKEMEVNDEKK